MKLKEETCSLLRQHCNAMIVEADKLATRSVSYASRTTPLTLQERGSLADQLYDRIVLTLQEEEGIEVSE